MYCSNCGNFLPDDSKFCDVCGTKTAHHGQDTQNVEKTQAKPKRLTRKMKILCASVVALVIVVISIVAIVNMTQRAKMQNLIRSSLDGSYGFEISIADDAYSYYLYYDAIIECIFVTGHMDIAYQVSSLEGNVVTTIDDDGLIHQYTFNSDFSGEYICKANNYMKEQSTFMWKIVDETDWQFQNVDSYYWQVYTLKNFNTELLTIHITGQQEIYINHENAFVAQNDTGLFFELGASEIYCYDINGASANLRIEFHSGEKAYELMLYDNNNSVNLTEFTGVDSIISTNYGKWSVINDFDASTLPMETANNTREAAPPVQTPESAPLPTTSDEPRSNPKNDMDAEETAKPSETPTDFEEEKDTHEITGNDFLDNFQTRWDYGVGLVFIDEYGAEEYWSSGYEIFNGGDGDRSLTIDTANNTLAIEVYIWSDSRYLYSDVTIYELFADNTYVKYVGSYDNRFEDSEPELEFVSSGTWSVFW